ncbi:MAG: type II secretion system F family protein [Hyphomicrobiales bacterium]|nr:type II secretion system F family protein [Hyphomicrobiales bacterium]MCP5371612.1 type II secretion system F family protein [Hyphomicrobiales bacterium]
MSVFGVLKYYVYNKFLLGIYESLGPDGAITLLAAVAAFTSVVAVWQGLRVRNPMTGRVKSLRQHRDKLRAGILTPRHNRQQRNFDTVGMMRQVITKLNLARSEHAARAVDRLAQAGFRSKDAVTAYLFAKFAMPFVIGVAVLILVYGINFFELDDMSAMILSLMLIGGSYYAPEIYLRNAANKRRAAIQKALPDALDLLVICAEAGLSLDAALHRVASEMQKSGPEIADEFGLTAIELGFLPERRQALANLERRTDMQSIRGVVNTLIQTERYGTPLAQSLRVLSSDYRDERMMKAEEKAAKLPATLTVPLICFIMPALFIVLIGPAIISSIDGLSSL